MPNTIADAMLHVLTLDQKEGSEGWSDDTGRLATAFMEYASIQLKEQKDEAVLLLKQYKYMMLNSKDNQTYQADLESWFAKVESFYKE